MSQSKCQWVPATVSCAEKRQNSSAGVVLWISVAYFLFAQRNGTVSLGCISCGMRSRYLIITQILGLLIQCASPFISQICYEPMDTRIEIFSRIFNVMIEKSIFYIDFMHKKHISAILGDFWYNFLNIFISIFQNNYPKTIGIKLAFLYISFEVFKTLPWSQRT